MIALTLLKRLRHEKLRILVAVAGVAAATALLVWSVGLTYTAMGQSRARAQRMTHPFNCWISADGGGPGFGGRSAPGAGGPARSGPGGGAGRRGQAIPEALVTALRGTAGVESVAGFSVMRASLDYRPGGRVMQGPPMMVTMSVVPADGSPYSDVAVTGAWPDPEDAAPLAAVCTSIFTPRKLTPPPLGSPLVVLTPSGALTVTIAAYIEMPQVAFGFPTLFTTAAAMRQAQGEGAGRRGGANLLLCRARDTAAVEAAVAGFGGEAGGGASPWQVTTRQALEEQTVSDAIRNFKRQAPLLMTLAALTAICMLANTMLVGIALQARTLALLRVAGMTAWQLVRAVAFEGVVTTALGWLVGVLAGRAALAVFVGQNAATFPEGVFMGWQTPLIAAGGVAVVAALALVLPCRQVLRIRALDALADTPAAPPSPKRWRLSLGLFLLFPMMALALPLPLTTTVRSVLLLVVGLPAHCFGLWLVLPWVIRLVERTVAPPLARLLRLDKRFLLRHDGRHAARTAGMVLTLTLGLGMFVAIHVWGASLTSPFIPSTTFPDVIVSLLPRGVGLAAAAKVAKLDGAADGRCLAIEAFQREVAPALLERIAKVSGKEVPLGNVLIFGAEPQQAFGGEKPLASFKFVAGERGAAVAAMSDGSGCLITKMFARQSGLGVGDSVELAPRGESGSASFKIAGVVDLNWHLVTQRANLRGRDGYSQMTMGPVFVSEAAARQISGNHDTTYHLWANLSERYRMLGPLPAGKKLEGGVRAALQIDEGNTVRVHHRDEISDGTIAHGAQLVGAMARVPFWSLVVLTTGMAALLVASVRARAREVAVMRAVGMTRGQLWRMLLGEALLATLCGVALSLLSGICVGWTFTGLTRAAMPFGGLPLTLAMPWPMVGLGVGFALLLCLVMALPALCWLAYRADVQSVSDN